MEICERVMNLLGRAENAPDFQEFIDDHDKDLQVWDFPDFKFFDFPELGFSVTLNKTLGRIESADFHIATPRVIAGKFGRFRAPLPCGIVASDIRLQVQSKLGIEPTKSILYENSSEQCNPGDKYWCDTYLVPPSILHFMFKSPNEELEMVGMFDQATIDKAQKRLDGNR